MRYKIRNLINESPLAIWWNIKMGNEILKQQVSEVINRFRHDK